MNTFLFTERHFGPDLVMRKVSRNQMGAYLCIASNDVPPAVSKRVILNVNCKSRIPFIILFDEKLYGFITSHQNIYMNV